MVFLGDIQTMIMSDLLTQKKLNLDISEGINGCAWSVDPMNRELC